MASITLTGTLLDPTGEVAVGDQIRFTHRTTTGETIQFARSVLIIPPNGLYNFTLEFGLIFVEYLDIKDVHYKNLGVVTVNGDTTATDLPGLLNAIVPPTDAQLLLFQGILADTEDARDIALLAAAQQTTLELIASTTTHPNSTVLTLSGHTLPGDGGGGKWQMNGVVGQTISQSPTQLADFLLNDGNGNQWALVDGVVLAFNGVQYLPLPFGAAGNGSYAYNDSNFEKVGDLDRLNPATLAIWQADTSAQLDDVVTTKERSAGTGGGGTGDVIASGTENGANIVVHNTLPLSWELRSLNAVKLRQWGVVGGALTVRVTVEAQKLNPSLRHTINPSIVDERSPVSRAIVFAAENAIQTVQGEGLEFGTDPIVAPLFIRAGVILDMQGGAIVRAGTSVNQKMITNTNAGLSPVDSDLGLKSCLIVGTGSIHGVSDQGAGLALNDVDNFIVEDVQTDDTNGDGFSCERANGTLRRLQIGDYGRNGMSPTSGLIYYEDIDIYGSPTAGANPGKDFDSETNDPTFVSEHYVDGLIANDVTFVDLHTTTDGNDFAVKATLRNCRLGPNFVPLRFISDKAKTVNARIDIDSSNTIISDNNGRPITFFNVSGGHVGACSIDATPGGSTVPAIWIEGEVNALTVDYPRINFDNVRYSIQAFDFQLNNAFLNFGDAGELIIRGSNNKIFAGNIDILTIRGASSIDNVIGGQSISSIITTDSGDLTKQVFQFGAARATAGAGANPIQGISFFTDEKHVPDGAGTSTMVIDLPDATAGLDGRVNKVCLGFTTNGSSTNTAYIESIIRRGSSGNAEVARPIDITSANASIVFTSADATSATFTLTKVNGGKFFSAVIG